MQKIITIIIVIVLVIVAGIYFIASNKKANNIPENISPTTTTTSSSNNSTTPTGNNITIQVPNDSASLVIDNSGVVQTPQDVTIDINNFAFNPSTVTVTAGTKVTWVNNDKVAHTVTASPTDLGDVPDSGTLAPGQSFSFTFDNAGSMIGYYCALHPMMKGTINVVVK